MLFLQGTTEDGIFRISLEIVEIVKSHHVFSVGRMVIKKICINLTMEWGKLKAEIHMR